MSEEEEIDRFSVESLLPKDLPTRALMGMRKFTIARVHDQSGVSGTGIVAEGVAFCCGTVAIRWLTPLPNGDVQLKDSLDKFLAVHVHPHPENKTIITWENGEQQFYGGAKEDKKEEKENDNSNTPD